MSYRFAQCVEPQLLCFFVHLTELSSPDSAIFSHVRAVNVGNSHHPVLRLLSLLLPIKHKLPVLQSTRLPAQESG